LAVDGSNPRLNDAIFIDLVDGDMRDFLSSRG
jgi:hypothetical protein